jgi:hypothetical protein
MNKKKELRVGKRCESFDDRYAGCEIAVDEPKKPAEPEKPKEERAEKPKDDKPAEAEKQESGKNGNGNKDEKERPIEKNLNGSDK